MKRSEAIKIIERYIDDHLGTFVWEYTEGNAEDIVSLLEEAGMLPPPERIIDSGLYPERKGHSMYIEYKEPNINLWESEDES